MLILPESHGLSLAGRARPQNEDQFVVAEARPSIVVRNALRSPSPWVRNSREVRRAPAGRPLQ
jgi:hypothetical protein